MIRHEARAFGSIVRSWKVLTRGFFRVSFQSGKTPVVVDTPFSPGGFVPNHKRRQFFIIQAHYR